MKYKESVRNFLYYLRNPTEEQDDNITLGNKVRTMVHLFFFFLLTIFIYGILLGILEKFLLIDAGVNINSTMVYRHTYFKAILIGVVAAPVLEELLFRLPLRYKYNYLLQWSASIISKITRANDDAFEEKVQVIWNKYFKCYFYFIILLFGCIHFFNFSNYPNLWSWIFVLVFPQIVIGSILGYIRVRFSLPWSMVYHAFHNFIFFSLAFLHFSTLANYQVKNTNYSFSMHKGIHSNNGENGFQVVRGKVIFDNYRLTDVLEVVFKKPGKYFLNNNFGDLYVNVSFITKQIPKNPDASLKIVSENIQKAMKVKFTRKSIKKDVWELYIADSVKYRNALLLLISKERNYSLHRIGELLDSRNKDIFIICNDTVHQFYLNPNHKWLVFAEIKNGWKDQYGLGFRQVQSDIEFINIE